MASRMIASGVWLVLVTSLVAAIDLYDELPPGDLSLMYQEQNYIDGLPLEPTTREEELRNLMLYKLITSLRNHAAASNSLTGPKWISPGSGLVTPETLDVGLLKDPELKRGSDPNKPKLLAAKPTPKWKNKGRVSSYMICYFKLCAFRPPPNK